MENYFKRPEISNSDMTLIDISITDYLGKHNRKPTYDMLLGNSFHCWFLEREKFESQYFILEKYDGRTKQGKEYESTLLDEQRIKIQKSDYENFPIWEYNIKNHPKYNFLFNENNEVEKEIFFEYKNIKCRSKLDSINNNSYKIIDLKTIDDITKADKKVRYDYFRQAAFYVMGLQQYLNFDFAYDFYFVFVEKKAPFHVAFIKVSEQTLERGKLEYDRILDKWVKYVENPNMYLGYNENIIIV